MSVAFQRPELLVLALPLAWFAWRTRREQHAVTVALRLLAAVCLVAALAGPYLNRGAEGRYAVFVIDRSASMPEGSEEGAIELIELGLDARGSGDEVRVVTFGTSAEIEPGLSADSRGFQAFQSEVGPDGSDLASGLETALSLIPRGRPGSLIVWTDGEIDGRGEVDAAVLAAAGRGVRIDVREAKRPGVADTAVERVDLAPEVYAGEPFLVTAWVRSSVRSTRTVRLMRGSQILDARTVELPPGRSLVRFRTLSARPGVGAYRVELTPSGAGSGQGAAPDRIPENDSALAATRILGPKAVLVVNHDGMDDVITLALQAAGIPALATSPERMPRTLAALDGIRAVVLENVSAARVGLKRLELLRAWTSEHGGGLLMTGGEASFGSGGYFRSPLDDLLPVSLEQRQEHRKLSVALSIALDRSGSMGASVPGGTKMDLANRGTVEALSLLAPTDSASVIAVDTTPHVIQAHTTLEDLAEIEGKVLGIRSTGGGIYTATALKAAARELKDAAAGTKHVILFADAADAEEQGATPEIIGILRSMGATLSVIGLGTESDQHADFLKECALDGGGEAYFTEAAEELPRLFAMDTQAVARSTFVEEPTPVDTRRDLIGLGELRASDFPTIDGYNLTYLREAATLAAVTVDDYEAPVFSFHARGLGRTAALSAQVGGTHGQSLAAWDGLGDFLVTAVRWLSGVEPPEGVFAAVEREGRTAVLSVEFDPDSDPTAFGESLQATVAGGADGASNARGVVMERVSSTRFEARFPLASETIALATVEVRGADGQPTALSLPPIALPYSPEYERAPDPAAGSRMMRQLASRTGGVSNVAAAEIFRGGRTGRAWRLLFVELLTLGLVLIVLEIAGRRLGLWDGWKREPEVAVGRPGDRRAGAQREPERREPDAAPEAPPVPETGVASALEAVRRSSRDRMGRG